MKHNKLKRFASIFMAFMIMLSTVSVPVSADTTIADHVIISQVYGAGGNSGAIYNSDFIELFNPTGAAVDLSGWSVQYASASGTTYAPTLLTGSIGANEYYLIQLSSGANGAALPTANVVGTTNLSGSNGKVALVASDVAITVSTDATVVDFVGYGTASEKEGASAAPATSSTTSVMRAIEGVDTDVNGMDFVLASPLPRTGAYVPETKCATPTASIASGAVVAGTTVAFTSMTQGTTIAYNTEASDAVTWTEGNTVTISAPVTVYVKATKSGLEDSEVAVFDYTIDLSSPITIAEAKAAAVDTEGLKVQGIVTYVNGKNVYIQDDSGAICLFLNANASTIKKGDEVIAMGKRAVYYNLIELANIDESSISVVSHDQPIPNSGVATIAEIMATPEGKTGGYDHMCEILDIKEATLTSTALFTQAGSELIIYPVVDLAVYPEITAGDTVDATIRVYDYKGKIEVEVISMTKVGTAAKLTITANPTSTDAVSGATILLSANDANAKIYYTLDGTDPTESSSAYAYGVKLEGNIDDVITLKAIAMLEGKDNSEILTEVYTLKEPKGALSIKEVLALPTNTENVEVEGTLSYFATNYGNPVIQSIEDGKTYSLYVYGAAPEGAKLGDVIKLKGKYTIYNGLPELTSITASEIVGAGSIIDAQEVTISDLKTNGLDMIGRYVVIKNATLGALNTGGNTPITVDTDSINIYKSVAYPIQVVAGDVVDVYAMVACYNTTVQLYVGTKEANGFNSFDVVNDTKAPVITLKDAYLDAKPNQDYTVSVTVEDNKGIESVQLNYQIGDLVVSNQAMAYDNGTLDYRYTIAADQVPASAANIKFTVVAKDVSGLSSTSDEQIVLVDNAPQIVDVVPSRNGSTGEEKSPVISVTLKNVGVNPVVTVTLKKDDATIVENQVMSPTSDLSIYTYATSNLAEGAYTAQVDVLRNEDAQTASTTWRFTVGKPEFKAYFGQLHAHTAQYSDGSGTLADGLNYIASLPANENVDFVSFTDHSNYFDTTTAANPAGALNNKSLMTAASLATWTQYVSDMTDFNTTKAGSIVAMPGFEMTWSGGPGHINTFNSEGIISRNDTALNNKTSDGGMKAYYEALVGNSDPLANLSQFNHPGTTFGTFSDFAYWSPVYDNKMVAVEVGNGEGAIGSGGYFPSYSEYTKALDKGWHVAPTNNQDNHKGRWGNSNTARTVIISNDLSTNGLLTGLKNMSVYATEDKNLNINYTVNDLIMGSIISDVPVEPLQFDIRIDDPDADDVISKVEIITNGGRIVEAKTFTSNVAEWRFEVPSVQGYYYLRVTQADKNIAVTAPVWIGKAPLVGISSLETTTKMPVTNEGLNVSATVFNNEAASVTLKAITYSSNGQVIATETVNSELAPMATFKHTIDFTPTVAQTLKITATVIMTVNGQDKTFTQDLSLNVRDSEKLVYVGIDASHYNEYVDGNYKDSMGNFADMAVDSDVRVVELETSEALIAATQNSKYAMLILTPPTRRNGSGFLIGYKSYTEAEIAAIKAFGESGRTIIITGWGDYYEGYTKYSDGTAHVLPLDQHMAAQQNKLLLALGSTLRVSDDEIKDDTNNGGQPQRLYLTDYNLSNPFLAYVSPSEQVYSNYGGATVHVVDGDGVPSTTLPATVSPMVYAFTTSYSADDDKSGTTAVEGVSVPKYNDKYMVAASETVTYENGNVSTVIVAGSAFMSNFEIQVTLDNYSTPAYSNYTILDTIVKTINPVTLTDIATVQAASEGESFTIRGIVTSNASGYDKETAFFDCIYVQDATAGINAFPVSGAIKAGQTVEIKGKTSSYNGERQIAVEKITVVDETVGTLPTAKRITTEQVKNASFLGSLVQVEGTITAIEYSNNVVESIFVKDSSGVAGRVFIDGYITKDKTIANLTVGARLKATGLSSIDTEGGRVRIRDRADIVCTKVSSGNDDTETPVDTTTPQTGTGTETKPIVPTESNSDAQTVSVSATLSSVTLPNGHLSAEISESQVSQMVAELGKTDLNGKKAVIDFKVATKSTDEIVDFVINNKALTQIVSDDNLDVKLTTSIGTIRFDAAALKEISKESGENDVKISVSMANQAEFSDEVKKAVGDRPVYDFNVEAGDKKIASFGSGSAQVALPYTLKADENPNEIVVYYVDDQGDVQMVRGNYDADSKTVLFMTNHFSKYMIGYNMTAFSDVKTTDWFSDAVTFVAARNIATGVTAASFAPEMQLTRGQFIVMLLNAYGIEPMHSDVNFADAGNMYYTDYLATAKKLGISNGVGNNLFAPDRNITRQDMMTLLYSALKVMGAVPSADKVTEINTFKDLDLVASYAVEPMKFFVENGYLSGNANKLNPEGVATRAQMAQILYELLQVK